MKLTKSPFLPNSWQPYRKIKTHSHKTNRNCLEFWVRMNSLKCKAFEFQILQSNLYLKQIDDEAHSENHLNYLVVNRENTELLV